MNRIELLATDEQLQELHQLGLTEKISTTAIIERVRQTGEKLMAFYNGTPNLLTAALGLENHNVFDATLRYPDKGIVTAEVKMYVSTEQLAKLSELLAAKVKESETRQLS